MITRSLRELRALLRPSPFRATGRVALITGGAGGIGSALAHHLASDGASVIIVDRDSERAASVAAGLPNPQKAPHYAHVADLTNQQEISALMAEIKSRYGRIDVLVNNAGIAVSERFGSRDIASIENEFLVNTLAPLYVTRLALDLLRHSNDPRVITTVSLSGIFPQAESAVYCGTKFGLRGAMLSLAFDLKPEGIKVSCVLPSATDTRMLRREALEGGNTLQFQSPPQTPDDVVRAFVSLLDRPRLEAYPKPSESRLVRAAMVFPNLLFALLPFFEGKGEEGQRTYLRSLIERGDVVEVDGHLELAP